MSLPKRALWRHLGLVFFNCHSGGGDLHIRLDDFVCFQGRKEDVEDPEEDEDAGGNGLDALQQVQVKVGGILWDQSP